ILIALGLVFLVNNLRPDLSLIDLLTRYWPFLLIAWGVIRLLEVIVGSARGRALPASGVSGGEWVLVVFICLIGSGFFFFSPNNGPWISALLRVRGIEVFGEAFDYPVDEKRVEAGKAPRVLIENFRGNARITGVDGQDVKVNGRKTVRAMQRDQADEANRA